MWLNICHLAMACRPAYVLTEGYPSVHSRTISLQIVRLYGMSQCGQYRYEYHLWTYENYDSQYSVLFLYQYLAIFFGSVSLDLSHSIFFNAPKYKSTQWGFCSPFRVLLVPCDRQICLSVFFKCQAYSNPVSSPIYHLSLLFVWIHWRTSTPVPQRLHIWPFI